MRSILIAFVALILASVTLRAQDVPQRPGRPDPNRGVYKAQITPHWFANDSKFWYRNDLRGGAKEFILVDAEKGKRDAAFDHAKLAGSLSKAAGSEYKGDKLPFDSIDFIDEGKAIRFKVGTTSWKCDLSSYECSKTEAGKTEEKPAIEKPDCAEDIAQLESPWPQGLCPDVEQFVMQQPPPRGQRQPDRSSKSPDGKWTALIKDNNVLLRDADGKETQLTKDGKEGLAYGNLEWAPDSKTLIAFRVEPGDRKEVYTIESSPAGGGRAKLQTRQYPLPGDKFTAYEMLLFDVATQKLTKAEVDKIDFGFPRLRWKKDKQHFTYQKTDRGHQRFRVIEVDSHTGKARNIIDEQSKTFVWTVHGGRVFIQYLDRSDEIVYGSERDGWHHLYLIDAAKGEVKNQITTGEYVVRGIDKIDEEKRQIWFNACGKNPDQDPYFIHYYRVNFDGTGLVALTEGNGTRGGRPGGAGIQFSPDRKYLIDTYSRVDMPPVHELRRVADGKLVCKLEEADISEVKTRGWEPPEVFVAKGRDSKTDIWGIIARPRSFDPNKKYPVLEYIYAGPQDSFVPKRFSAARQFASLTDLGFIVVQIDGMGTANRSKAFHDVCWHNLKDAGFPDRILWHQAVAKKYAYYDLTRVGIYGTSAGGQNSTGAVLFHPEFYKAAVSACGCHDNRMDKASWNEQWMGYPVEKHYAECSNIDNAHQLQGKLMLIVGELDDNVPPESTFRLVNALIRAGKDFDLLVMPGLRHTNGGEYGVRRMQDFFVRHLKGNDPPDRNGSKRAAE
jgi:Prolyl oligopeptidase family/Dipeptidyl peptidase IV (DPP IV) N-terminal region